MYVCVFEKRRVHFEIAVASDVMRVLKMTFDYL